MWTLLMLTLCSSLREGMRPSQCHALCENGRFVDSVNPCNTCENRKVCSLATEGRPGCDCLPGYLRNAEERCVLEKDCEDRLPYFEKGVLRRNRPADKISCRDDEVFLECSCEKTCCNGGQTEGCSASCSKGCFCKKGMVRHEDGRCIRLHECEKKSSPGSGTPPVQCSMPKCDVGCSIDYTSKPCPSCACTGPPIMQCSPPKCGPGCSLDYSTKPCPSCSCPNLPSPTKCGPDEELYECMPLCTGTCSAYSTKSYLFCKMACRSGCFCRKGLYKTEDGRCVPASQCTAPNSPPENDCGANAEYKTCGSACPPTCANRGKMLLCTQQCVPGCFCKKGFVKNEQGICVQPTECQQSPPIIQCSPPKCGPDCSLDYSTKPCPSCSCPNSPPVQCSIPNCDVGCSIDYSTEPCPSCSCTGPPGIQCSIPNCDEGCSIDYTTKPCPSCSCTGPPGIQCDIPNCDEGCSIDYTTKPCPSCFCSDTCGEDEEYKECGSACPPTCSNLGKNQMCTLQCVSGCFCADGLVRNEEGECVEPEECPENPPKIRCTPPRCGPGCSLDRSTKPCPSCSCPSRGPGGRCGRNKQFYECIPRCSRTCEAYTRKPKVYCRPLCRSGCFCREGLYERADGQCVPPTQCPAVPPKKKCERNEVFSECANPCNDCQTRGNCNFLVCNEGCDCKKGYHRNSNGQCIPAKQCPVINQNCPQNEVFSKCVIPCNDCQTRGKCNFLVCNEGCDCKKGYYRNSNGECIPANQCPVINPTPAPTECASSNEQYYECIPRCMRTCKAYTRSVKLFCSQLCVSGCFCKEGLYEADDGTCVPPEQCLAPTTSPGVTPSPNQCGADEQFYDCIPGCQQTCFALISAVKIACKMPCRSGCYCREGLYKKDDGSCVPPEGCFASTVPTTVPAAPTPTPRCPKNEEYYSCIPTCKNTCENYQAVKPLCPRICIKGCSCKKGFVKRSDGKCVKPEKCGKSSPPIKPTKPVNQRCKPDEQLYNCVPTCKNTCENYQAKRPICPLFCRRGCFCKKGLVKRSDGKCVRPDKCKSSSPTPTPPLPTSNPTCMLDKDIGPCRQSLTRYFYNYRTGQCEKFKYGGCSGNKNNFKTKEDCQVICGGISSTTVQCSIPLCRTGCTIDHSTKPCPSCSCPTAPPPTNSVCMQPKQVGFCRALIPRFFYNQQTGQCEKFNYGGCGGNKNNFEKKEDCEMTCGSGTKPSPPKCGEDEQYYKCIPNCQSTCDTYNTVMPCPLFCKSGCYCKGGMVKNRKGKCVKPSECEPANPPVTAAPLPTNSVCLQPKEAGPCFAAIPRFFYNLQTGGCEKFNYGGCAGNKNNFAKKRDCERTCGKSSSPSPPKCGKDEEYYSCVPNCHNTCDTYKQKGPCPLYCMSGCFCKRGMVKNKDGECVQPSQCPSTNPTSSENSGECGANEEFYDDCAPKCTGTCEAYKYPGIYHCPRCFPGCWCSKGFVKRSDGQCVPPDQCNVPTTTTPSPTSNSICQQPKVVGPCKARVLRYFYNQQTGQCEQFDYGGCRGNQNNFKTKEECEASCGSGPVTPTCGNDEQYYPCIPNCRNTCANYNKTNIACPAICISGCFCKQGLVKNDGGSCVPPSQCNALQPPGGSEECGDDEVYYDDCAPKCASTCEAYNNGGIYNCPLCRPGCWCDEGLVKRSDGQCVPPEQCNASNSTGPPEQCGEDEEYYKDCAPSCGGTCETYQKLPILNCRLCRPGCWCSKGLVKRKDGKCVPKDQCGITPTDVPPQTCSEDEEYLSCGSACPPSCSTLGKNDFACIALCVPGCFCKQGLIRNAQGECVEPEDCPQNTCGEDEEYKECGSACPPTCSNLGKNQICTQQCVSGCFCSEGLVRNEDGECVEPEECPQPTCNEDEEYKECGSACPPSCSTLGKNVICTRDCVPGCFCNQGLVRNDDGECVEPEECPQGGTTPPVPTDKCGANEEYKSCGTACPVTCSNVGMDRICTMDCVSGCFCKEGFVRNDRDQCVQPLDCPQKSPGECGEDEKYYDCAPSCGGTCDTYNKTAVILCLPCGPGCWCNEGLVKNGEGKCVPKEQCEVPKGPNKLCGVNEIYYDKCVPSCRGTCLTQNQDILCPECTPGCWCKKGYLKNQYGKCVLKRKCNIKRRTCPFRQKYYECMPDCQNRCNPPDACAAVCKSGCFCDEGLVMDENGTCVRKEHCKAKNSGKPQCGPDQEHYDCFQRCRNSCATRNGVCPTVCESGCFCKKGLMLDSGGKCVKADECEDEGNNGSPGSKPGNKPGSGKKCSGVNEEVVSCAKPKTCNTCLIRGNCKLKRCQSGCDCKNGYYRDDSGKCIPQDQCPGATPQCSGKNEEVVPCAKPKWCNTCGIRGNCKLTGCKSGCDCKKDYYRDGSGVCIPQSQCPASNTPRDSNTGPENTIESGGENDSSFESSYSEESFSSISETQSSESDSTSQSSNIQKKSSGSRSWFTDSESGNEVDFETNSSEELEAEYSSIATERSSDMSSDSEQSSSKSSSGSGMWSSSSSSRSKRESGENEIDSFDESAIFEDKSSSDKESGYSSMSYGSESWSTDMSSDSEQSSSKSSSGSGMWSSSSSSRSKRESGENEIDSFDETAIFEDKSSSDKESGYSSMSYGSESWSTDMSSDSEQSSSKSSSGSGMWSSSSSSRSKRDSGENEIDSFDELEIFEDESSSDMESGYSTMSSDSESWSVDKSDDSKMSSSRSSSGSEMWSSKMSSEFESEEEKQENNDEAIYAGDGNAYEEYFYSLTEVEGNDEN